MMGYVQKPRMDAVFKTLPKSFQIDVSSVRIMTVTSSLRIFHTENAKSENGDDDSDDYGRVA